jgi:hypothetical protein
MCWVLNCAVGWVPILRSSLHTIRRCGDKLKITDSVDNVKITFKNIPSLMLVKLTLDAPWREGIEKGHLNKGCGLTFC